MEKYEPLKQIKNIKTGIPEKTMSEIKKPITKYTCAIFPDYNILCSMDKDMKESISEFGTRIRIKRDSIWYLVPINVDTTNDEQKKFTFALDTGIKRFTSIVYRNILLYKIDPKNLGRGVVVDTNQQSEEDRIFETIIPISE